MEKKWIIQELEANRFSASSEFNGKHSAVYARLNSTIGSANWSAKKNDQEQWLQIDTGKEEIITSVTVQGRFNHPQWVTKYDLQISSDLKRWVTIKNIEGAKDQNTPVVFNLPEAFSGRYVRFAPTAWDGHISMRVDVCVFIEEKMSEDKPAGVPPDDDKFRLAAELKLKEEELKRKEEELNEKLAKLAIAGEAERIAKEAEQKEIEKGNARKETQKTIPPIKDVTSPVAPEELPKSNCLNEAKKQLNPITVAQIKETLKRVIPEQFEKMIITDDQPVTRCNYIFAKIRYQKAERQGFKINFPLFSSLKEPFDGIEGGVPKLGDKSKMPSDRILEVLHRKYSIDDQPLRNIEADSPFDFPFDIEHDEISPVQIKYFFPGLTYKETCSECNGHKYITCQNSKCNGRHNWICTECSGKGKLTCGECAGHGWVSCRTCNGSKKVKCSNCGGDGRKVDKLDTISAISSKTRSTRVVYKKCSSCAGKGQITCTKCNNGKVTCQECSGNGKVNCHKCHAKGDITCPHCYGDKDRYGKIDCPQCQTEGVTAQIVYISTDVSSTDANKFILEGPKLNIKENQLKNHISKLPKLELVYRKVNDGLTENYDEFNKRYMGIFEKELDLDKIHFPLTTKEEIYYQVIPCVELNYKHMLTNSIHKFAIIDFWNDPEINLHSEPEQLNQNLGNVSKALGGFWGKLLKTKGFKTKEDKRNEIVLLIHLVKADGKIEDQEKVFLSEMIGSLDDFTNSEKQNLFYLINTPTLPEVSKADMTFSSKERGQDVVSKLIELANADGEMAAAEKALIDKITNMI